MLARTALLTAAFAASLAGQSLLGEAQTGAKAEAIRKIELGALTLRGSPALPGVSSAFVRGAFDASGLYTAHSKMREGSVFPPHSHPDERLTVVISGTMYLGEGTRFEESALIAYPAGTVAVTPAGTPHFMAARGGDFSVLEIGSGPSGTAFTTAD